MGSPLCGLSSCLPRPLGSLFRGRRGLRLQARVSLGVCALGVSVWGAMEFRATPDFGFDASDSDSEDFADTERLSQRIKFLPWFVRLETEEEVFAAWGDGYVSDSGSSASSCSSDHSDMSVDSETEYWSNQARLSLQEEEEETAYLAGLIDDDVSTTTSSSSSSRQTARTKLA